MELAHLWSFNRGIIAASTTASVQNALRLNLKVMFLIEEIALK